MDLQPSRFVGGERPSRAGLRLGRPLDARMIVESAREPITARPAMVRDVPFIDQLQKMHGHAVGWMPTTQLIGLVDQGAVLIADDPNGCPMGYLIAKDRYMCNDACGIVFQLNVVPIKHRRLIGAFLVKSFIERAAYGMRLLCCWCAQDLPANHFWESLGFVPLAFRTGSRGKQRIHIFWQLRVCVGDNSTPYWYPAETHAGAVRENRLILPIPPGTHWREAKPVVLPALDGSGTPANRLLANGLPDPHAKASRALPPAKAVESVADRTVRLKARSRHLRFAPPGVINIATRSGVKQYGQPTSEGLTPVKKPSTPKAKNDPSHVKAARELRDKYLESFNANVPAIEARYDVNRLLSGHRPNRPILDSDGGHSPDLLT